MVVSKTEARVRALERCLDRESPIAAIAALRTAALGEGTPLIDGSTHPVAIGLDTGAVFRLTTDRANTDAVDFLAVRHEGPLILPGQVIQEFWNNRLTAIGTYADAVRGKYRALADEVARIDPAYGDFRTRFEALLAEFAASYALAFEPGVAARIAAVLETLERRATVPYVPRARLYRIAQVRNSTKTPPGFKDAGDSDFFVWADYLLGLLEVRDAGREMRGAVLVTADEKPDWSRAGQAHPLLVAEVGALAQIPFETWNLTRLREHVASELNLANVGPVTDAAREAPV